MSEPLGIGTTIRSSCPGAAGRLLPDRLAISFSTDPEGNIASLAAPLDPPVKEVVFPGAAAGDCTNPVFRQHCTRMFSHGGTIVLVGQDMECWWLGERRVRRLAEARMSGISTDRLCRSIPNYFRCWRLTGCAAAVPVLHMCPLRALK